MTYPEQPLPERPFPFNYIKQEVLPSGQIVIRCKMSKEVDIGPATSALLDFLTMDVEKSADPEVYVGAFLKAEEPDQSELVISNVGSHTALLLGLQRCTGLREENPILFQLFYPIVDGEHHLSVGGIAVATLDESLLTSLRYVFSKLTSRLRPRRSTGEYCTYFDLSLVRTNDGENSIVNELRLCDPAPVLFDTALESLKNPPDYFFSWVDRALIFDVNNKRLVSAPLHDLARRKLGVMSGASIIEIVNRYDDRKKIRELTINTRNDNGELRPMYENELVIFKRLLALAQPDLTQTLRLTYYVNHMLGEEPIQHRETLLSPTSQL